MNKLRAPIVAVLVLVALAVTSISASAHYLNYSTWDHSKVIYKDILSNYGYELGLSAVAWNNAVAGLVAVAEESECSCDWDIQVADNDYGDDFFGRWSGTLWEELFVDLNDYHLSGAGENKRRAVITHEFGHAVGGLGHHDESGRIMQSWVGDFYDTDGLYTLDSGTISEIDYLW